MISFPYTCPFCSKDVGFQVTAAIPHKLSNAPGYHIGILARCPMCHFSISSDFHTDNAQKCTISHCFSDIDSYVLEELINQKIEFFPRPKQPEIPEYLPEKLKTKYLAAEDLYLLCQSKPHFLDSAGNAYRAALELGLALLENPDTPQDKNLNWRINQFVKNGMLVQAMGDFAHRIRALGNLASHSTLDFSQEELNDLRLFTRLFLMYTFTLPAMLPKDIHE